MIQIQPTGECVHLVSEDLQKFEDNIFIDGKHALLTCVHSDRRLL